MIRSASIRRMLIAVMMLLTVTPDGVLRPCCCTRIQAEDRNAQDVAIDVAESPKYQPSVSGPIGSTGVSISHKSTIESTDRSLAQLPPCCQKRLQTAKRVTGCCHAKSSRKPTVGLVSSGLTSGGDFIHDAPEVPQGLNDSRSCRCRAISNTAKVERLVFRQIVSRIIAVLTPADELAGICFAGTQNGLFENNNSAWLIQRSDSARLCRWVI